MTENELFGISEQLNDLISRQAAIDALVKLTHLDWKNLKIIHPMLDVFEELPSAQPEIIKCKDCLHWVRTCGDNQWGLGDCDVFDKHLVMCEGYCAWAERRTDG